MAYRNNEIQKIHLQCRGSIISLNIGYIMKQLSGGDVAVKTGDLCLDADTAGALIEALTRLRAESMTPAAGGSEVEINSSTGDLWIGRSMGGVSND